MRSGNGPGRGDTGGPEPCRHRYGTAAGLPSPWGTPPRLDGHDPEPARKGAVVPHARIEGHAFLPRIESRERGQVRAREAVAIDAGATPSGLGTGIPRAPVGMARPWAYGMPAPCFHPVPAWADAVGALGHDIGYLGARRDGQRFGPWGEALVDDRTCRARHDRRRIGGAHTDPIGAMCDDIPTRQPRNLPSLVPASPMPVPATAAAMGVLPALGQATAVQDPGLEGIRGQDRRPSRPMQGGAIPTPVLTAGRGPGTHAAQTAPAAAMGTPGWGPPPRPPKDQ